MAYDMFLQIEGIEGDSTDAAHTKWIEVESYNHRLSQPSGGSASAQGALTGGRADHQEFTVTKRLDSASPLLALHCCNGQHIPEIKLELCRAMGDKTVFMLYTLKECIVSSVVPGGSGDTEDPTPSEDISFRYGEIHWAYTETDPTSGGKTGGTHEAAWSVLQNQQL